MLSICIPVYNSVCLPLVKAMHDQCQSLNLTFEIIVLDDGSSDVFKQQNESIKQFSSVVYKLLPQNIGRAAIRNQLAELARYEFLLFLDGDVLPASENFIKNYRSLLNNNAVVVGGRKYAEGKIENESWLHYTYGKERECVSAVIRQKKPYESFVTGNFVIPKLVFQQIKFDTFLSGYGHEDTLFGIELEKNQIPIRHIDNPTLHKGIDQNGAFFEKQIHALDNLIILIQTGYPVSRIKIYAYYLKLEKFKINLLLNIKFYFLQGLIKKLLLKGWVKSLFLFDLYRLLYLSKNINK